eukprot:scaffold111108_cov32-Tisochrysis_lutea.AAC.3
MMTQMKRILQRMKSKSTTRHAAALRSMSLGRPHAQIFGRGRTVTEWGMTILTRSLASKRSSNHSRIRSSIAQCSRGLTSEFAAMSPDAATAGIPMPGNVLSPTHKKPGKAVRWPGSCPCPAGTKGPGVASSFIFTRERTSGICLRCCDNGKQHLESEQEKRLVRSSRGGRTLRVRILRLLGFGARIRYDGRQRPGFRSEQSKAPCRLDGHADVLFPLISRNARKPWTHCS